MSYKSEQYTENYYEQVIDKLNQIELKRMKE